MGVSIDQRTRTSADLRPLDADAFLRSELPALLDERGHQAAPAAAALGLTSFTLLVDDLAATIAYDDGRFTVTSADTGAAAVVLTADELTAIVNDTKTPMTLLTGGTLSTPRGDLGDLPTRAGDLTVHCSCTMHMAQPPVTQEAVSSTPA